MSPLKEINDRRGGMYFYERVNTYEIAIFNLKQTRVYCPAES